jgi:hypothetical protein
VLPLLLRRVYLEASTGLVRLQHGADRASLCIVDGQLAWAGTNLEECWLGACLVRHGRLTEGDYLRASLLVGDGQRLGEVLLEAGLLDATGLSEGLVLQAREILMTIASWTDGTWELVQPLPDSARAYATPLPISTAEIILDAVWSLPDAAAVSSALGDLARPLVMTTDGRVRAQQANLTIEDGFILSRVDGTLTASDVLDISQLERGEAERRLLALVGIGILDYEAPKARPHAPARPAPEPAAPTGQSDPYAKARAVPVIQLSLGPDPAAPQAPAPAAEAAPAEEVADPRQRLAQLREMMKDPSRRKSAERALRAFLVEEPRCADAYHLLGLLAREHGAERRALDFFRKAVELDPGHAAAAELTPAGAAEPPSLIRRILAR